MTAPMVTAAAIASAALRHGHHGLNKPLTGGGVFALLIILGIIFILNNPKGPKK